MTAAMNKNKARLLSLLLITFAVFVRVQSANAACTTMPSDRGTASGSFSISNAGSYRVWVRMLAPDTNSNSVALQLDDGLLCSVNVGDSGLTANTWTWVDWRDGNTASKIDAALTAGQHTYKLAGRETNVLVDSILFVADAACVPTGINGANCTAADAVSHPQPADGSGSQTSTDSGNAASGGNNTAPGSAPDPVIENISDVPGAIVSAIASPTSIPRVIKGPYGWVLILIFALLPLLIAGGLWFKRKWIFEKTRALKDRFVRPKATTSIPAENPNVIVIRPNQTDTEHKLHG